VKKLITAAVLVALATPAMGLQQVKKLLLAATAVLALAHLLPNQQTSIAKPSRCRVRPLP